MVLGILSTIAKLRVTEPSRLDTSDIDSDNVLNINAGCLPDGVTSEMIVDFITKGHLNTPLVYARVICT